ncbi:MAG: hypothetical protein KGJ74_07170 [Betaproteobacteria bacterium]|jgi:hypothetical protein|nr:hypothetical protein [Betaproteobacteria bacterium]
MFILTLFTMLLSFMALLGGAFVAFVLLGLLLSKISLKNEPQGRVRPLE